MRGGKMRPFCGLLTLLLAIAAPAMADKDAFTFRFAPDPDVACLLRVERTDEVGPGRTASFKTTTRVLVAEQDGSYRVSYVPVDAEHLRNGEVVSNPLLDLVQSVTIVHELDADGRLERIQGFEELAPLVRSELGEDMAAKLAPLVDPERLGVQERAEWNNRYGDFIGKSAKIGDVWTGTARVGGPKGPFETRVDTTFEARAPCAGTSCVRIVSTYGAEPDAPLQGRLERLVDPATLQIYEENLERSIRGNTKTTETRRYECAKKRSPPS